MTVGKPLLSKNMLSRSSFKLLSKVCLPSSDLLLYSSYLSRNFSYQDRGDNNRGDNYRGDNNRGDNNRGDRIHFDKVTNYDSLNQRISQVSSADDALSLLSNSAAVLRVEHAAIGLRAISRQFKNNKEIQQQINKLAEDQRFKTVIEKVKDNIDNLPELACCDILFFLRKTR